ncbi:hypothetical protein BGX27_009144 [Mortierella sp. AM989]|nr:hypothetical protein BGX27_009144 [Mortierella sp. AM989]
MLLHSLNIPEIIEQIVKYLPRNDLVNFIRVSSTFHDSTIPVLYETITLPHPSRFGYPSGPGLERYKHHIKRLEFSGDYPQEYLQLTGCHQLQTICAPVTYGPSWYSSSNERIFLYETLFNLSKLIERHSLTIQKLIIRPSFNSTTAPPKEFFSALKQCSQLTSLEIGNMVVKVKTKADFYRICTRLSSLSLKNIKILELSMDSDDADKSEQEFNFSKLKTLKFINNGFYPRELSHTSQALMIRRCPSLKYLHWESSSSMGYHTWRSDAQPQDKTTRAFCNTLAGDPWVLTRLQSLVLPGIQAEDEDIASFLKHMDYLVYLTVTDTRFGPHSFRELLTSRVFGSKGIHRPLCVSIETLNLRRCKNVTGPMVQTLLASCPNLKSFQTPKITVTDISTGDGWVCHKMNYLYTDIEADVDLESESGIEAQKIVYSRLGSLTRLKVLALTKRECGGEPMKTIDLRLKSGLDLLAPLKDLYQISFHTDYMHRQNMGIDEANWMVENWPSLVSFTGRPSGDSETRSKMRSIFSSKKLVVIDFLE